MNTHERLAPGKGMYLRMSRHFAVTVAERFRFETENGRFSI